MNYWLIKSEPNAFSIDDLTKLPGKTDHWDGVRNYQARNFLKNDMKPGDLAFFYHSNCNPPGIVGIVTITKAGYPDHTAWDPNSDHYDPASSQDNPRWFMVDIQFKEKFKELIGLHELKEIQELNTMKILQRGNRLSVTPVTQKEWNIICDLANTT